jgi:hypothetical protein
MGNAFMLSQKVKTTIKGPNLQPKVDPQQKKKHGQ